MDSDSDGGDAGSSVSSGRWDAAPIFESAAFVPPYVLILLPYAQYLSQLQVALFSTTHRSNLVA